jgi:molybdopterin-containing oxidoreductase family membrane subunit
MQFFSDVGEPGGKAKNILMFLIPIALLTGVGFSFGLHAMVVGHDHVFGTTREVPWGVLITPYVLFACLSTGACIVSSLGQVFRIKPFEGVVNRSVFLSIIAMATGLAAIGLEIESPWRMGIYGALSPNALSNIWWKSSIYTLFLLFMSTNLLFLLLKRERIARGFAIGALLAITCGNLNMNSDMALLGARGFWAENYMPLFFLITSTLLGTGMMVILLWLGTWLHDRKLDSGAQASLGALFKLSFVLIIGVLAYSAMKILGGFSVKFTENPEAMALLVRGDFAVNFWLGEIVLAGVLPLLLLTLSNGGKRLGLFALAGLSALIGIFVIFYDLIIVGQLIPHFHQYNLYDVPAFYSYSPSLHEVMMVVGSVGFFISAVLVGEFFFNSTDRK